MNYEKEKRILRKNRERFIDVNANAILSVLTCFPRQDEEKIQCAIDNKGNTQGMYVLLDQLQRRDNWPTELCIALRSSEVNHPKLADLFSNGVTVDAAPQLNSIKRRPEACSFPAYDGNTKIADIDFKVIEALKMLDDPLPISTWEALGAQLGYSFADIQSLKCKANNTGCSITHLLMNDWKTKSNSNLARLVMALREIGRSDIYNRLVEITGYDLPTEGASEDVETRKPTEGASEDVETRKPTEEVGEDMETKKPTEGVGEGVETKEPTVGVGDGVETKEPTVGVGDGVETKEPTVGVGDGIETKEPTVGVGEGRGEEALEESHSSITGFLSSHKVYVAVAIVGIGCLFFRKHF